MCCMDLSSDSYSNAIPVIVDSGCDSSKVGFGGDPWPRVVFPSIVGRPRDLAMTEDLSLKDAYVGDEAQCKRGVLAIDYPIQKGVVANWDSMEEIWHHMFYNELHIEHESHPVLVTESPLNPAHLREKTIQFMFEKINSSHVCLASQPVLSLYASGLITGTVLDSGEDVTHLVPIYEGYTFREAIEQVDIGGRDVTDYLAERLRKRGFEFSTKVEHEILHHIKASHCYVVENYEQLTTANSDIEEEYVLPDARKITLGRELFTCPEVMFKPRLLCLESLGVHERSQRCVMKCDPDAHKDLYGRFVISGGNTLFPGFAARLQKELSLIHPSIGVKVIAPANRQHSAWVGASMAVKFMVYWITKEEYEEVGGSILNNFSI